MKILVICQHYYPENFAIYKIAEQLVKDGHEVDVLTGKPNYGYGYILPEYRNVKEEDINGVHVYRVNIPPRKKNRLSIIRNYLSFWRKSKKWVNKCKKEYDVVYSMNLSPITMCSAGNYYSKKHHVPHIIHCVDLWPESVVITKAVKKGSLIYKILYKWSKDIYSKATTILVGSPSFKDYFAHTLKLPTENVHYVPQCSLVEKSEVREYEYGKGTHILYCGNLGLIQLIPLIGESMQKVVEENKDIYFHVIGMGPMSDYFTNDIKKRGLENNVIYHGPMNTKIAASYFKSTDALYVSLKSEGAVGKTIPNKLMMSMAFAKPIIAVLEGDGKEILEESHGALFAKEDSDSIKDAILKLAKMNKKEKDRLGELNHQYYLSHFSCESVTKEIEKYLK